MNFLFHACIAQSAEEFDEIYHVRLADSEYDISTVYIIAFDTIWTLALALNKTEEMRLNNITTERCSDLTGELVPLSQFNYSNAYMGCIIKEHFHKVNFTGVSVNQCQQNKHYCLLKG